MATRTPQSVSDLSGKPLTNHSEATPDYGASGGDGQLYANLEAIPMVLIVDDEAIVRAFMRATRVRVGYHVTGKAV